MAYKLNTDYSKLIKEAEDRGDYLSAAQYERDRNTKISTENLPYEQTDRFSGWLDDTDYSSILTDQMSSGASAADVASTLGQRVDKAANTAGMEQWARDDTYNDAIAYIMGNQGSQVDFSTVKAEDAQGYANAYQSQIDALTAQITGRTPFSYDYTQDPMYQQYKEVYTTEGDRAMQDTLGQVAARTGGIASSYATTAAQGANDYYMQQLAGVIPELRNIAYGEYMDEGTQLANNLNMLLGLENQQYGRYQDNQAQQNYLNEFAYQQQQDELAQQNYLGEFGYMQGQDELAQQNYLNEFAYQQQQDALAQGNYDREFAYMQQQDALDRASSRGGSSGGYYGGSSDQTDAGGDFSLYEQLYNQGVTTVADAYAVLVGAGYTSTEAQQLAEYYAGYTNSDDEFVPGWMGTNTLPDANDDNVFVDGVGEMSWVDLEGFVEQGLIIEEYDPLSGQYIYRMAPGLSNVRGGGYDIIN